MKFFSSRGLAGLGAALGILNLAVLLAGRLNAAPSDIRGSDNVAVASYSTSKGSYILWSSGRITNAETGKNVAPPYSTAKGFVKASPTSKMALGSPNVAVDYLQNSDGTFTLYADGSVMKADDEGASAPGGGGEIMFSNGLVESGIHATINRKQGALSPVNYIPLNLKFDREPKEGGVIVIPTVSHESMTRHQVIGFPFRWESSQGINRYSDEFTVPLGHYWTGEWVIVVAK